ncbi:MAG: hypothetical protein ACRBF0_16705 [Calditrichia bacterium]
MGFIKNVPLFALLLVAYNVIIIGFAATNPDTNVLDFQIAEFPLPSGKSWIPTNRDVLILIGLVVLYIELIKSTQTATTTVVEHTFSMFVFIIYLVEFLMLPQVADSAFLILGFMSLIDVIAGFTITISTAKRDFSLGGRD